MATTLYDLSVASYLQALTGAAGFLEKGRVHYLENNMDLAELVETQFHADMWPFRYQVLSVAHHSLGAIRGLEKGQFSPPTLTPGLDYKDLQALVANAIEELQALPREAVDALAGKPLLFKLGRLELPFTAENFVLSFSLPNLYFHTTTTYDMLRMAGVPVGKQDYMGPMRVGA